MHKCVVARGPMPGTCNTVRHFARAIVEVSRPLLFAQKTQRRTTRRRFARISCGERAPARGGKPLSARKPKQIASARGKVRAWMQLRAAIFDFDGTIADTFQEVVAIL